MRWIIFLLQRCYNAIMKIIIHWLVSAIAVLISAYILAGVSVDGFLTALILAVVLGAINGFVKPVLVFLTLPITVMTLGLFILILNTLLILLAEAIVPGFSVDGFLWAFLFSVVLSIVSSVLFGISKPAVTE